MCAGGGQVVAEDRPRVVRRAGPVGPAGRRARRRRREDRLHRRDDVRAWRPCSSCPPSSPTPARNDIRIEAALAKLWSQRDGLADRRRARADPRRPRLRDRRRPARPAASGPCRPSSSCATCGSTGSSRARPRSCTCSSPARRSTRTSRPPATLASTRTPTLADKAKAAVERERVLRQLAAPARRRARARARLVHRVRRRSRTHLRFVERSSRKLARADVLRHVPVAGALEYKQGFLGRVVDIGAELFAMAAPCSRAEMLRRGRRRAAGRHGIRARRRVLRTGPAPRRAALRRAVDQHRRRGRRAGPAGARRRPHLAGGRACSTRARAPARGSPSWDPGPSQAENVRRRVR